MSYLNLCNYCSKWIPHGLVIEWNHGNYHATCAIQVAVTDTQEKEERKTMQGINCAYCNEELLAASYQMWRGRKYHELCMAKAIQEFYQPPKEQLEQQNVDQFIDDEDFEPDYFPEDYDEGDNPEGAEWEDETRPAELPEFTNGHTTEPFMPEVLPPVPMVHVAEVARNVVQRAAANGSLMLGTKGSRYVTQNDLYDLPVPPKTHSWQPVPHYDFIRKLLDGLWDRRMVVTEEKYAVSSDGLKLFGLLQLQDEYDGVNYAIGLKNSNDKSTRLSLAVGYVVKVCSNGMINGDYHPLTAKHTANFNLEDSLSVGIDRIKRSFLKLNGSIERKRDFALSEGNAQELVYKAFMKFKLPISLINTVHRELFIAPSYDEFKPLNLWSLENSFTTAFKRLQPTSQFEATAKLAKFIDHLLIN